MFGDVLDSATLQSGDVNPAYIGGGVQNFIYNFGTKTAGTVLGCPMKIYQSDIDILNIPNPTDIAWQEIVSQLDIDTIKVNDTVSLTKSTTVNGKTKALMVEVDLTPVCNNLYGSSNNALKAGFSSMLLNAPVAGSARIFLYGASWAEVTENNFIDNNYIGSSNKVYILISASSQSDGSTASSVSLNYISVQVNFTKLADMLTTARQTRLTGRWMVLLKDIYFSDNNPKCIMSLYSSESEKIQLWYDINKFKLLYMRDNILEEIYSDAVDLNQYQMYNFMIIQSNNNISLYVKNELELKKYSKVLTLTSAVIPRNYRFSVGGDGINESNNSNIFYALGNLYPGAIMDNDTLTQNALTGMEIGFEHPEFIDMDKFTLHANAVRSNDIITLKATSQNQESTQIISVFPNSLYKLTSIASDFALIKISYYYNDVYLGIAKASYGSNGIIFKTPERCNNIKVSLGNYAIGDIIFTNVSIKRYDGVESITPDSVLIKGGYIRTGGDAVIVKRSGISINPLSDYNFVGNTTIYQLDELITIQAADMEV